MQLSPKPRLLRLVVFCLVCSCVLSSRFTLRPAASFPPVASSADLLRCRRKSLKVKKTGIKKPPCVEKVESHCHRKWPIMLGSDCSGMGTDVVAAKQLGIEFMVQFATDVDPDCRKVILSHKKGPRSLGYALGNVCEKCDLYTAGFPCQPYSRLPEQVAVFNRVWVTFCFFAHRSLLSLLLPRYAGRRAGEMRPT